MDQGHIEQNGKFFKRIYQLKQRFELLLFPLKQDHSSLDAVSRKATPSRSEHFSRCRANLRMFSSRPRKAEEDFIYGHAVLRNHFASACVACRETNPHFHHIIPRHAIQHSAAPVIHTKCNASMSYHNIVETPWCNNSDDFSHRNQVQTKTRKCNFNFRKRE